MQKPIKRGDTYRITVRFNSQRFTATRDTAQECEQWAAKKLLELQSTSPESIEAAKIHISFYSLFDQYYNDHGRKMKSSRLILQHLKSLKKHWGNITEESIHDLTPILVKTWRDARLKQVKPSTVNREISMYSSVFDYARKELFLTKVNPFKEIIKPNSPPPRSNRISDHDIDVICKGLD